MDDKIFVIMEVRRTSPMYQGKYETQRYVPSYQDDANPEFMWLRPDSVIECNRLRYGIPKTGDTIFYPQQKGGRYTFKNNETVSRYLIMDKSKAELQSAELQKPKSALEVWLDSAPESVCQEVKDWIKSKPE